MEPAQIAVTRGDGVGVEVTRESEKILKLVDEYTDYRLELVEAPAGGAVWKEHGVSLPEKSFETMKASRAILFGAIGLPDIPLGIAESAILQIRQRFDQYVNLRPVKLYEPLFDKCPLREEYIGDGIEIHTVRENTEGLYVKIGGIKNGAATNTMLYTRKGCERIIKYAFEYARRKGFTKVTSVDKANILACSQLWRQIFHEIGDGYGDIEKEDFYIDAFCQWLIRKPYEVQVVVTGNMFGDIASDEAAYLIGSLGMAASGNINPDGVSMYEPIHGSAPDIAGQGIANPLGSILSLKIMFEETFRDGELGKMIEQAVEDALREGRTPDVASPDTKVKTLKTTEMGDLVGEKLVALLRA
ncbi:MAG: isocitrate/isopropylmalate dehydrogenase family protein [Promethearchaeota archaeon]